MKTWITKEGEEIPYKELTDSHLMNILKFIKRKAAEGVSCDMIIDDGWNTPDIHPMDTIYGEDVLEEYDFDGLEEEAKKRNLIKRMSI
jgi:hypothetical protein